VTIRPTPSQERWLAIGRRFDLNADREPLSKHVDGWRTASLWSRCVLFVLGVVAAAMSVTIGEHLWSGAEVVVAGVGCTAVAEWLILKRRHFFSGIEESLEVSGFVMLAYECSVRSGASEHTVAFALAMALAAAGFRLLSPGFTTLSALALIVTLDAPPLGAGLCCYFIGLCALMGGKYTF